MDALIMLYFKKISFSFIFFSKNYFTVYFKIKLIFKLIILLSRVKE